jgi:alkanesulfonate monooxygenase SsuD/methylene tetrahydromethanopterin reductase-like flavin-dependent oxidoreductase (luciferase family)
MIGSTEAEAQRLAREVNDLTDPVVGRKRLSGRFGGHDFSHMPLDQPLVPEDFPDPSSVQAARSRTEVILNLVRRDKPTLRQLLGYLAGARGHYVMAGTPEQTPTSLRTGSSTVRRTVSTSCHPCCRRSWMCSALR